MCHRLASDEVIFLHLLNTILGIISEDGADAALRYSADPQKGFQ